MMMSLYDDVMDGNVAIESVFVFGVAAKRMIWMSELALNRFSQPRKND